MALSNKIGLILVIVMLFSCGSDNENAGFVKAKVLNQIKYELHYLPSESFKGDKSDSIQVADLAYYKFIISEEENMGKMEEMFKQSNYNKLLYYINTEMNKDLLGYYDDKESKPVQIYFESNNRLSKKMVFLLAFEKSNTSDKVFSFSFKDNIFHNGPIKFQYNLEDLKTL